MDRATPHTEETRLSVRLSGPLAEHANRQVKTELYSSHSEYIRDLVRRDMVGQAAATSGPSASDLARVMDGMGSDDDLVASIRRGLADVAAGRYHPFDADDVRARAMKRLGNPDQIRQ